MTEWLLQYYDMHDQYDLEALINLQDANGMTPLHILAYDKKSARKSNDQRKLEQIT